MAAHGHRGTTFARLVPSVAWLQPLGAVPSNG
jgi:hypothetical protein